MKRLWDFFASVWLTIALSAVICAVAVWGSLLTVKYPQFYRALDQKILFPWLYYKGFSYIDLTLWIYVLVALTALFTVNTVVCTLDKVYAIIKNRLPARSLFAHIVHFGFMLALLGHFVGSTWGFRDPGTMVFKGKATAVAHSPGLSVRLEGVEMEATEDGDLKSLKTKITLLEDGKEALTDDIEINGPVIYRGMAFYHADQGQAPEGLILDIDGERAELDFSGSVFRTRNGVEVRLGQLFPDLDFAPDGRPYSRSENFMNPHVAVIYGSEAAFLNISRPGTTVRSGAGTVTLLDYRLTPYVVLTINKDPGIWFIIAGSAVLVVGMVLLLFFRGERGELVRKRPEAQA